MITSSDKNQKPMFHIPSTNGFSAFKRLQEKWERYFLIGITLKHSIHHITILNLAVSGQTFSLFVDDFQKVLLKNKIKNFNLLIILECVFYERIDIMQVLNGIYFNTKQGKWKPRSLKVKLVNLSCQKPSQLILWAAKMSGKLRSLIHFSLTFQQVQGFHGALRRIFYWTSNYLKHLKTLSMEFTDAGSKSLVMNEGSKLGVNLYLMSLKDLHIGLDKSSSLTNAILHQISLGAARNLSKLKSLSISLSNCLGSKDEIGEIMAANIAKGRMKQLRRIKLNLSKCSLTAKQISNICFAFGLQIEGLEALSLDFSNCNVAQNSSDVSFHRKSDRRNDKLRSFSLNLDRSRLKLNQDSLWLADIIQELPQTLQNLSLNLGSSKEITEQWINQFGASISAHQENLQSFRFEFRWCASLTNECLGEFSTKVLAPLHNIKTLTVSFGWSDNVSDEGVHNYILNFIKKKNNLQQLRLDFEGFKKITRKGLQSIGSSLNKDMKNLLSLHLNFRGCQKIQDEGVEALRDSIGNNLINLEELTLDFRGCDLIRDRSLEYLSSAQMVSHSNLSEINFLFSRCKQLTEDGIVKFKQRFCTGNNGFRKVLLDFKECNVSQDQTEIITWSPSKRNNKVLKRSPSQKVCNLI